MGIDIMVKKCWIILYSVGTEWATQYLWFVPILRLLMEEFFYISHQLTDEDHDGRVVLGYELMLQEEHRFRIKWGGGIRCHQSPLHSASNTPPNSPETLDHVTWSNPESRMLECLMWSIYDGILTLGPTPKLVGPESYNQVHRHLTTKVFKGLYVHCSPRNSAQFDEPPLTRVRSVVLVPPKCDVAKKVEFKDATSPKKEDIEEGAVGGK